MTAQLLTIAGSLLIGLSVAGFAHAWRLDRALRTLMPRSTEELWRRDLIRDIYRFRPEFALFEALDAQIIPIRWRRSYHGVRGVALANRFYFSLFTGALSFAAGISLLA